MSQNSEPKTEPGPWVRVHFENSSGSVTCPTPVLRRQTPSSLLVLVWLFPMVATCSKGDRESMRSIGSVRKHHGKKSLIDVHRQETPVSRRAEVEMFMVCFFVVLDHVGLSDQAEAAMENLCLLVIIRLWIMTLLCVTRSPSQPSIDSSEWCSNDGSF